MEFIEALEQMKSLCDDIYSGGKKLIDLCKKNDETPRHEIAAWIRLGIEHKHLVLRSEQGTRTEISKAIKDGTLFPTSFSSIMATNKDIKDKFEYYIDNERIFDTARLSARKGLSTDYAIKKAVSKGNIVRVDDLGSAIALYVA